MRGPICDVFSLYIWWLLYWKCFNNKLITTLVKILLKLSVTPVICLEVDCFFSENALEIDFGKCFGNCYSNENTLKMIVTPSKIFATPVKMLWKLISLGENALENICYSSENALKIDFIWWKCFGRCLYSSENALKIDFIWWKCFGKCLLLQWKCFENWRISDRNIHMILNNV